MFSPLPPKPNGIADYTFELLTLLSKHHEIRVVVEDGLSNSSKAPSGVAVVTLTEYEIGAEAFSNDLHIYQVGNNPDHAYMLPFITQRPGIVVLHDPSLHHLVDCATVAVGHLAGYKHALRREYGAAGAILADHFARHGLREQRMYFDLPMTGALLTPALGVIVHSRFAALKALGRAPSAEVTVVPHQYSPPPPDQLKTRFEVRTRLGLAADEVVFISLGFVTKSKQIPEVLRALAELRTELPPFRYVIAGELRPDEVDVADLVDRLGLGDVILLLGYVEETEFFSLIEASDVVVNLRYPVGGETSGSMIRALGGGACTIVVDRGPFAEIADEAACKIRWGAGFEIRLREVLHRLAWNPELRRDIGAAAKRHTDAGNSLEKTVAGYNVAIAKARRCRARTWQSDLAWEFPPPHELARMMRELPERTHQAELPLWFRAGAVPIARRACRAMGCVRPEPDGALLRGLGFDAKLVDVHELRRIATLEAGVCSQDFVLVSAPAELFRDEADLLPALNALLAFGGILVVNVEGEVASAGHPLLGRDEGERQLSAAGFSIDDVIVAATPGLDDVLAADASPVLNERCWRAVKTSSFTIPASRLPLHSSPR